VSLSNYINKDVIERLDSLNQYMLSEGKEREMREESEKKEKTLAENENEANNDDNRNRVGLDSSSVLRLNKIR
jgi:hypothetical protein